MALARTLLASAVLAASFGAHAVVTGTLAAGPTGPVIALTTETPGAVCSNAPEPSNDCTLGALGSPVATIVGGTIYNTDMQFADDVQPGVPFLAAGPSSGGSAVMTFTTGTTFLGLLWGSPDTYNILTLRDSDNVDYVFTTGSLGFTVQNGDQSFAQYVQFVASAGTTITQAIFASNGDAFETTVFSLTPIPEPETYALMAAGLGALGFVGRRRRRN